MQGLAICWRQPPPVCLLYALKLKYPSLIPVLDKGLSVIMLAMLQLTTHWKHFGTWEAKWVALHFFQRRQELEAISNTNSSYSNSRAGGASFILVGRAGAPYTEAMALTAGSPGSHPPVALSCVSFLFFLSPHFLSLFGCPINLRH